MPATDSCDSPYKQPGQKRPAIPEPVESIGASVRGPRTCPNSEDYLAIDLLLRAEAAWLMRSITHCDLDLHNSMSQAHHAHSEIAGGIPINPRTYPKSETTWPSVCH